MPKGRQKVRPIEEPGRAINASNWQPLPGMARKRCVRCRYWFAVKAEEAEVTATCPDCAPSQARKRSNNSKT